MSRLLVTALLAFVGVASGALLWEGIAAGAAHGMPGARGVLHAGRARLVVGAIGLAAVLWIASGILTHAW